jgi:DNA repair exonuclease SbcCD ATPase subunit
VAEVQKEEQPVAEVQKEEQPVAEVQKEEQPAAVAEEVPKPKELAVPLDCNPDPACIPLKQITPGVMDCCAQTISSDPLLAQDTPVIAEGVERQQQQPEAVAVAAEAESVPATPEVKEIEEELQEARIEQVKEIEMELSEAKEELRQQEEELRQQEEEMKRLEETESNNNSKDINSIAAEETQSVVTAPVLEGEQDAPKVELPSEADAGVTVRVFEWGPGHVPPNDA